MEGLTKVSLPMCSATVAIWWALVRVCMPLSRQRSSACLDSSGKASEIMRPLLPRGLNSNFEPTYLDTLLASAFASSGFQSKVSRWLGPPCMNMKITRFAFGAKCEGFGASGLMVFGGAAALAHC